MDPLATQAPLVTHAWWIFLLIGLGCGIFSATFGVGGGILMVPILVIAFSMPQKSAQGIALAAMVPMALVGAIRYRMHPDIRVDLVVALLMGLGGVGGAIIGTKIAAAMPVLTLRRLFALVMIAAALHLLLEKPKSPQAASTGGPPTPRTSNASTPASATDTEELPS